MILLYLLKSVRKVMRRTERIGFCYATRLGSFFSQMLYFILFNNIKLRCSLRWYALPLLFLSLSNLSGRRRKLNLIVPCCLRPLRRFYSFKHVQLAWKRSDIEPSLNVFEEPLLLHLLY